MTTPVARTRWGGEYVLALVPESVPARCSPRCELGDRLPAVQDPVDEAVVDRLPCVEHEVAAGVLAKSCRGLTGVLGEDRLHLRAQAHDLLGLECEVGQSALASGRRLVEYDARVREHHPAPVRPTRQEQGRAARCLA